MGASSAAAGRAHEDNRVFRRVIEVESTRRAPADTFRQCQESMIAAVLAIGGFGGNMGNRGFISIRMPGSNVHEIGLRWGNEHEGIVGKLSKKNGKSCTNTAIGSTAGGRKRANEI